jgi:hypothetical protein
MDTDVGDTNKKLHQDYHQQDKLVDDYVVVVVDIMQQDYLDRMMMTPMLNVKAFVHVVLMVGDDDRDIYFHTRKKIFRL